MILGLAAVIVGSLTPGCSAEEGVLIAVSGSSVDTLQFHVGVRQGKDFVLDKGVSTPQPMRIGVSGRGLQTDPFELLLRRESPADLELRVLVIGLRRDKNGKEQIASFGLTEPPQRFIANEVVRRSLTLDDLRWNRKISVFGGCYRARLGNDYFDLVPHNDRDCDGAVTPADCNDTKSSIHPGAREVCDGLDNNCDGKKLSGRVPCFALESDSCYAGTRECAEASGGGLGATCATGGEPVAFSYCAAYDGCKAPDPQTCSSGVTPKVINCKLEKKPGGASCGVGKVSLAPPTSASKCRWILIDSGGFEALISSPGSCKTELKVQGHGAGPVVVEFLKGTVKDGKTVWQTGWVRHYAISVVDVEPCSETPLTCGS